MALVLAVVAIFLLLGSWKRTRELTSFTRHRAAAVLLGESLLEEIRAHRFGRAAPASWSDDSRRPPLEVWIDGHSRPIALRHQVTCKSGAFVGLAEGNRDEVTVTIDWDNIPPAPPGRLEFTVPVWRE